MFDMTEMEAEDLAESLETEDEEIKKAKKGLRKAEKRKAKAAKKKAVKRAKHKVRMMFDMTEMEAEDLAESLETEDEEIKNLTAKAQKAKIARDKAKVAAKFAAKVE